ncbi:hypothetical protein FMM05_04245 [Flavobacterium zepuense]|uniref:Uncharacterized protein n=1 Tax=Flavobacterium zepuense TaxID=2593302 RepID=A0A552V803_9FLAO|nr:hypothetical protein [Flavobacterium zepuense]TRW26592.1 hypothetical protein FMM05_04245 [Flavobacterium zepuense]
MALISCSDDNAEPAPQYEGIAVIEGNLEIAASTVLNANPRCYLDLVTGTTYRVNEAAAHAANIDMVLGTKQEYNETFSTYAASPSSDIFADNDPSIWPDDELFKNWPVRNTSLFVMHGSKGFTTVINAAELAEFIGDTETYLSRFLLNSDNDLKLVYVFKVKRGDVNYTGAIKFDINNGNEGDFKYIIKLKQQ